MILHVVRTLLQLHRCGRRDSQLKGSVQEGLLTIRGSDVGDGIGGAAAMATLRNRESDG